MDVTPLIPEGRQIIQSYAGGRFKVSGVVYDSALLVCPEKSEVWNTSSSFADLKEEDFAQIAEKAEHIDVFLLGTGNRGEFFPPDLRRALKAKGLPVETMDTGAACRTYNVLMAEGRRVIAALMPVS